MSTETEPRAVEATDPNREYSLINMVLARRADRSYAGWTASVRRAITPATEVSAYGVTEQFMPALLDYKQAAGLRRAAAICAAAKNAPQDDNPDARLGHALAALNRSVGGSNVEQRVTTLPLLDMENAAISLGHLVALCSAHRVPVDFHELARTLTYWGDGISVRSQKTRRRLVHDFYTSRSSRTETTTDPTAQEGPL